MSLDAMLPTKVSMQQEAGWHAAARLGAPPWAPPGSGDEARPRLPTTARQRRELRVLERWVPTVFAGRRVLEAGAGTGSWTRFIAPQTHSLLATDGCEQSLAIARRRVPSAKVRFACVEGHALPPTLGQFDAAFAGFRLSRVPRAQRPAFFRGLHARLEPGAKVLLLDSRFVPGYSAPLAGSDDDGNTYQLRRLSDGSEQRVLKNYPDADDLLQALDGLALRPVLHQWLYHWALCYEVAAAR